MMMMMVVPVYLGESLGHQLTMVITPTLIFPLSVLVSDFHTHCFQLVCGTTLA